MKDTVIVLIHRGSTKDLYNQINEVKQTDKLICILSYEKKGIFCDEYLPKLKNLVKEIVFIKNYDNSFAIEEAIYKYSKKFKIIDVCAMAEYDQFRLVNIKAFLNIDNWFSMEQIKIFRNKIYMKDYLSKNNINVANYLDVNSYYDILKFIDKHSFPIVLKYQEAGGSVGTYIIKDNSSLHNIINNNLFSSSIQKEKIMVEKFINAKMFHVNGIVVNGKVIYSNYNIYVNSGISYQDNLNLGSIILSQDSIYYNSLNIINNNVIGILPKITSPYIFHNEYFIDNNNNVYVCEVASRVGGGPINDLATRIDNINMVSYMINNLLGDTTNIPDKLHNSGGFLIYSIGTKDITYKSIPDKIENNKICSFYKNINNKTKVKPAISSMQSIIDLTFYSDNENSSYIDLKDIEKEIQEKIIYE